MGVEGPPNFTGAVVGGHSSVHASRGCGRERVPLEVSPLSVMSSASWPLLRRMASTCSSPSRQTFLWQRVVGRVLGHRLRLCNGACSTEMLVVSRGVTALFLRGSCGSSAAWFVKLHEGCGTEMLRFDVSRWVRLGVHRGLVEGRSACEWRTTRVLPRVRDTAAWGWFPAHVCAAVCPCRLTCVVQAHVVLWHAAWPCVRGRRRPAEWRAAGSQNARH